MPKALVVFHQPATFSVYFLREGWALTGDDVEVITGLNVSRTERGDFVAVHVDDLSLGHPLLQLLVPSVVLDRLVVWPGLRSGTCLSSR